MNIKYSDPELTSNPGLDLSLWWGIIASLKNGTFDVCSYICAKKN
jgi:hypothetical protein